MGFLLPGAVLGTSLAELIFRDKGLPVQGTLQEYTVDKSRAPTVDSLDIEPQ